jgi:DNA-binding XRE family transcriptional regulator
MTQDQFGAKYGVSGPAVFKFEKGYVKPSLDLWLKMSRDLDIPEKKAVLLWVKAKLPQEFQSIIDIAKFAADEDEPDDWRQTNYARISDPRDLRKRLSEDQSVPKGIRQLVEDDEFWALYRPTGPEVQILIEKFGDFTDAKPPLFREALRLVRDFMRSEF